MGAQDRSPTSREGHVSSQSSGNKIRLSLLLPLIIFFLLAGLFLYGLFWGNTKILPSTMIGKPVPTFSLPPVEGLMDKGKPVPTFSSEDLAKGKVTILNFWASWCTSCIQEHPYLIELKRLSGAQLFGINYKDPPAAAQKFLDRLTNPFDAVAADRKGRIGIEFGVYGLPETFIIDGTGRIVDKHIGPIDAKAIQTRLLPLIKKLQKGQSGN